MVTLLLVCGLVPARLATVQLTVNESTFEEIRTVVASKQRVLGATDPQMYYIWIQTSERLFVS